MKARVGAGRRSGNGTKSATPARTVPVDLGARSYPIRIGRGTLAGAGGAIARRTGARHAVIVTVPRVGRRYGAVLRDGLEGAGLRVNRITVPDGDASKNLDEVRRLYDALLRFGADRDSVLVALGGGVVGDLTGFAAASYLRGIQFVQVPTSLLAMVDSSIGGKVGVNLPQGKNLVGAFHQPRLVWIDIDTLRSLPARQRACGFAEAFKKAAIWDAKFFARIERDVPALQALEPGPLIALVQGACRIKAEIVKQDEREAGVRTLLNFGHTLGHAVEKLTGYRDVLHGEAVAMGMLAAARRSEALDLAPAGTADRIEQLALRFGLPTELPPFPRSAYIQALGVDKKMRGSRIRYVVLRGIGSASTVRLTPAEIAPRTPGSAQKKRAKPRRKRAQRRA
ncbi:MAG: 3-dehydroquinate synthase [Myxococcota bacterium]